MHARNAFSHDPRRAAENRARTIRSWLIVLAFVLLVGGVLLFFSRSGETTSMTATRLTCYSEQYVTPFGENVLYYDGTTLTCLKANGALEWNFTVGSDASFACSNTHVAAWVGTQLYILDSRGRATYNDSLSNTIQFARVGDRYVAIVVGDETNPQLIIKDLQGAQVDEESAAFSHNMLMDVGFYGEEGQYMWTLSMDVYSTAVNMILHTFQVGKMNTGEVSLGEKLVYNVLFENKRLRVFSTQQMYTYDYKAIQDTSSGALIYGWKLIDHYLPARGDANMLLMPISQSQSTTSMNQLRLITGSDDRRFTLPTTCVGATVYGGSIFGFSGRYTYRTDVGHQQFYPYEIPLPQGVEVTGFLGRTTNGYALLACGEQVYSLALPIK